jgi:Mrp family chromosome partitioning ATPase
LEFAEFLDFVGQSLAVNELLSQLTDATVLVIRGHKTPMAAAYKITGQFQAVRANVLGVVLTNITPLNTNVSEYFDR